MKITITYNDTKNGSGNNTINFSNPDSVIDFDHNNEVFITAYHVEFDNGTEYGGHGVNALADMCEIFESMELL